MKKLILTGALILILTAGFYGCQKSQRQGAQDGQINLTVWHQWSNDNNEFRAIYNKAIEEYQQTHPNVRIRTESLNTEAYKTKITAEFAGRAKNIDVFYFWGAGMISKFVNSGKLLPLDPYIDEEMQARIRPGTMAAFRFDDKTYSTPMFSWYLTLFCNTELFERADAPIPETYDELLEAVRLLNAAGITPIAAGARDPWRAAFMYQALALREVGADTINATLSGNHSFEDPGFTRAAERLTELYTAGAFGKNPLEEGSDDADSRFVTGRAAMVITGSWFSNTLYTDPSTSINPDSVIAVKIPLIPGKSNPTDYEGGFVESFWANAATPYPAEAAELALFLNERIGISAYETGVGLPAWPGDADESRITPLFVQIKDLIEQGEASVFAWDIALDARAATVHNESVQALFTANPDIAHFIELNQEAIGS